MDEDMKLRERKRNNKSSKIRGTSINKGKRREVMEEKDR